MSGTITGSKVVQAVTEFSWNCVMDSDISPLCFLYIQKDRLGNSQQFLQNTFHSWTLHGFLHSVFMFLGNDIHYGQNLTTAFASSQKWQKQRPIVIC